MPGITALFDTDIEGDAGRDPNDMTLWFSQPSLGLPAKVSLPIRPGSSIDLVYSVRNITTRNPSSKFTPPLSNGSSSLLQSRRKKQLTLNLNLSFTATCLLCTKNVFECGLLGLGPRGTLRTRMIPTTQANHTSLSIVLRKRVNSLLAS